MSGNSSEDTFFGNRNSSLLSLSDDSEPDKIQILHGIVQEALQNLFNVKGEEAHYNEYKDINLIRKNPEFSRRLYARLTEKVSKKIDACLEKQNEANDLHKSFSELKELSKKSSSDDVAWRPPRNVDDNIRSVVMEQKIRYRNALESIVSQKENKVAELKNKVLNTRNRKEAMDSRLQVLNDNLYNMVTTLNENVDGLID